MNITLHKKQMFVLRTLMDGVANEILWGGAAGGGKSFMLRAIAIIFAMEVPRCNIYLFRRTVKDLIATHMRGPSSFPVLLNEFVEDKLVKINYSSSTIEFSNGSIISLNHIQYESDLEKYLSAEMHVVLFDESTTFTPKMIKFIRSRLRLGSLEVPPQYKKALPFALYATNPRGPSHLYFKSNFVDRADPCTAFRADQDEGGMMRMFVPALLADNPTLTKNDPDYVNRVMGMGDPEVVKAYINGDWNCAEGAALPSFSREHHVKPKKARSIHWPVYVAYDYGFSAPYSVLYFCIANGESSTDFNPPKGSIVIVGEIYGDDGKENGIREDVGTTAKKIYRFHQAEFGGSLKPGPADNAIFSREQGPSIHDSMSTATNGNVTFVPADKSPGSRIGGLAVIRRLLENVIRDPHELSGFYVLDSCPRLIEHLSALALDEKDPEDVDTTQPDHDWDTTRYIGLFRTSIASSVPLEGV
jgi:hypothetical protein